MKTLDVALVQFFRRVEVITAMEMGGKISSEESLPTNQNRDETTKEKQKTYQQTPPNGGFFLDIISA